jgi:hypothetical protein
VPVGVVSCCARKARVVSCGRQIEITYSPQTTFSLTCVSSGNFFPCFKENSSASRLCPQPYINGDHI